MVNVMAVSSGLQNINSFPVLYYNPDAFKVN
jgi:hypothetical protein